MADSKSEFDTRPLSRRVLSTYASTGGVNILKTTPGFIHAVTFSQLDAAPTAGTITIYDYAGANVYASGADVVLKHTQTTAVFMPQTVILDVPIENGLAVGFTAAIKDVNVVLSFK